MALSEKEKGIKSKKLIEIEGKITARTQVRDRIAANYQSDIDRLNGEIEELQLQKKALEGVK